MVRHTLLFGVLALVSISLTPRLASALLTIDDLDDGDRFLLDCDASGSATTVGVRCQFEQLGLDPSKTVGGRRFVELSANSLDSGESLTAGHGVVGDDSFMSFSLSSLATGELFYSTGRLDVTMGGALDRILVDLSSVNVLGGDMGRMDLILRDGSQNQSMNSLNFSSDGTLAFAYADLTGNADLTTISLIYVRSRNLSGDDSSWRINDIRAAVPESSTNLLLAAGLVGLAIKARYARDPRSGMQRTRSDLS